MSRTAHVACNFDCLDETEGLIKITTSHVHCTRGKIFKTVQYRDVVITTNRK